MGERAYGRRYVLALWRVPILAIAITILRVLFPTSLLREIEHRDLHQHTHVLNHRPNLVAGQNFHRSVGKQHLYLHVVCSSLILGVRPPAV
ncbi:hypothetical protein K466DRAFT_588275 [Polyporus arcularius HHB13444]|uniref:Uncharacterized protein n=1 Tax=Polyporus arcularius HHB13444 TaxID=1314778 RepID=A0A5C3P7K0_9APHY|nr:hypothetical protein K466DRAFT_588275 [Polyporus arcularius HHB13444]